jgi:probable HAF family extracellular repeat protein
MWIARYGDHLGAKNSLFWRPVHSKPGYGKGNMKQALYFITIVIVALGIDGQLRAQEQTMTNKQPTRYIVTDLGLAADQVEGISNNGSLDYTATLPDGTVHATFRRHGKKSDLGTLGGANSSALYGPSERGQVVGKAETSTKDPNGEDFCFYGTNLICLAFVWQNGQMTALPILDGNNATANDTNNRGEIVGYAETNTPDPTCPPPQVLQSPPVIWKNGVIHELPTFSGDPDGGAFGINDKGQAVGESGNCTTPLHAVLWGEDGQVKDLGNLGGTVNVAQGINNLGHVVGASNLTGDTTGHAFLWTEDKGMQDLGTVEGDSSSYAFSVNDKDQVVGISADLNGNFHAFVWQDGVMTDLNKVIPPGSHLDLIEAFDINARGEIVGLANDPGHVFLAIPCDEQHADSRGCKEGDAADVQSDIAERPKATLSEHARKLLWQGVGGRYRIIPPEGTTTGTGREDTVLGSSACAAGGASDDHVSEDERLKFPVAYGNCELDAHNKLNGACIGRGVATNYCLGGGGGTACPVGSVAKKPGFVFCLQARRNIPVDRARRCPLP